MNIFNIGKANARITELETEKAALAAQLETEKTNAATIATAAEAMKTELDDTKTKLSASLTEAQTFKTQLDAKTGELSAAQTKILELEATIAKPDGAIQKAAAIKASQIAASQGIPPLKADANETSGGEKDFSGFVADYVKTGKTKSEAVQLAIKNHPKEYAEARAKGSITL